MRHQNARAIAALSLGQPYKLSDLATVDALQATKRMQHVAHYLARVSGEAMPVPTRHSRYSPTGLPHKTLPRASTSRMGEDWYQNRYLFTAYFFIDVWVVR